MEDHSLADGRIDRKSSDDRIEMSYATTASSGTIDTRRADTEDATSAVADGRSWFNGLFRWRYIIPRALLAALVWTFFAYGFDPMMRYGIVVGSEAVVGAKVDVELVQTRFFPPEFAMRKVGITDPRRTDEYAVTFDCIDVRVAGEPLIHREFVIEEAVISGLKINADRLTDGALEKTEAGEDEGLDLGTLQKQLELLGLQWYDSIEAIAKKQLDPNSLETVIVAESVEAEWKSRVDQMRDRIEVLQHRIDAVKEMAETKGDALARLDSYTRASTEVQSILQESKRIRVEVRDLPVIARRDVGRIDQARKNDTARLQQSLQAIPLNPTEITKSLLGPELAQRLETLNAWLAWTKRYFAADVIAPPVPQSRGEWISFPRAEQHPSFALKLLSISGEATRNGQPVSITGECRGISSNAALYGKPANWRFAMAGPEPLTITGHSDLTDGEPLHEVAFNWNADRPISNTIGQGGKLAILLSAGSVHCDGWLRLDGRHLEAELNLRQDPLAVAVTESSEHFAQRWIAPALASIKTADAKLQLFGTTDDLAWQLQSDVGQQVAAGFQHLLTNEVEGQRLKLMAKADAIASEQRNKLPEFVNQQTSFFLADLTSRESRAKQAIARFSEGKLDVKQVSDKLNLGRLLRR